MTDNSATAPGPAGQPGSPDRRSYSPRRPSSRRSTTDRRANSPKYTENAAPRRHHTPAIRETHRVHTHAVSAIIRARKPETDPTA